MKTPLGRKVLGLGVLYFMERNDKIGMGGLFKLCISLCIVLFSSCDFIDEKLSLKNNSDIDIIVISWFFNSTSDSLYSPCTYNSISTKDTEVLGLLNRRWHNLFEKAGANGYIKIVVIEKNTIDSFKKMFPATPEFVVVDSILKTGKVIVKEFKRTEIEDMNWSLRFENFQIK
ncbi:MAG: hypothetical protein WAT19_10210 [Ferruginibacter sp.]